MLSGGVWKVASYVDQDIDETENYADYVLGFNENGRAFAEGAGNNYFGSWIAYRNEGLHLGLNFRTQNEPFSEFINRWKLNEITLNQVELKDYNSNGEIERILILEKTQ